MSNDSQPTDMPHRLFREPRYFEPRLQESADQDDLSVSISSSLALVEKAAELVDSMQETVRMHEDTIYNQNNEIAQLNGQKEDVFDKLVHLEEICRREADKASKAETQTLVMSGRVKTLEQKNTNLTAQLDRMIQTISKSFASRADTEVFGQPLRAVS